MAGLSESAKELAALGEDIDAAAEIILNAAERCLALVNADETASEATREGLSRRLQVILAACAFQDLAGQRLAKIARLNAGEAASGDALLNGPQLTGQGVSQAEIDALLNDA